MSSAGALIVDMGRGVGTLDPAEAPHLWEVGLIGSFYARLTQYASKPGPTGTTVYDPAHIKLWLAKSVTISKNGLIYTFKLRPGLKFPSGHAVDSQAVKYTFKRLQAMNASGAAFAFDNRYDPPQIKSIGTPDPTTVVITLNEPDPNALQNWGQPSAGIVDPSVVEAHGGYKKNTVNEWMTSHVAGYGPYLLKSYIPNKQAVLVANPGFFEQPATKAIIVNFITDDSTLLLRTRSGRTDVTLFLSKQATHSLVGKACCRLIKNPVGLWEMILLPNKYPPFSNRLFRQALAYAVPYQQILDNIALGYGQLYYGPWSPSFPWFDSKISKPLPFDLARAKQLIAASGVKTPVSLVFNIPAGNGTETQIATAIQAIWQQLGVNLKLRQLSASAYDQAVEVTRKDAAIQYDGPGVIAPDYQWGYDAKCEAAYNAGRICVPAADKLIDKLYKVVDPKKRQAIINRATKLWIAAYPRIQVYGDIDVTILGKRVKHYYFDHEMDLRTWSLR
jgi:peptide/nickel transport system substrate-binding protein